MSDLPDRVSAVEYDAPQPQSVITATAQAREKLHARLGAGIRITAAQKDILARLATYQIVDLLPTGEIYVPGDKWRAALNEAFDPMGWALKPVGQPQLDAHERGEGKSVMYREVYLVVSRCSKCFHSISACECKVARKMEEVSLSMAYGAQEYFPGSKRMTFDDAAEGCMTNGLMRCCKAFGVFANIWDKQWANDARDEVGVKVMVTGRDRQGRPQWRRLDARPFEGENGLAHGSPNADRYTPPTPPKAAGPRPAPPATKAAPAETKPPVAETKQLPAGTETPAPETTEPAHMAEKILGVRAVKYTEDGVPKEYWILSTDQGEYYTKDADMYKTLENLRQRGLRVEVMSEPVATKGGVRRRIVEFAAVTT